MLTGTDFQLHQLTQTTLSLQTPLADLHRRFYPYAQDAEASSERVAGAAAGMDGTLLTIGPVEMPTFTFAA